MKKKLLILIPVIIAIGLIVGLRYNSYQKSKYISVKAAKVSVGDVKSYLSTTGIVKSQNYKEYYGTQLKIKSVNVKVGDQVKKDQVLLTYDVTDLNTAKEQTKIQYDNAILQQKDTQNQRDIINSKIKDLDSQINSLSASKNPMDIQQVLTLKQQRASIQPISDEKIQQLDNSVKLAKLAYDSAMSKYTDANLGIKADFEGVVTAVNVTVGSSSSFNQAAIVIQDLNNLKVLVSLGKYDASKIKINQEAEIKNSEGNIYKGTVSSIDPAAKKSQSITSADTNLNAEIIINDNAKDLKVDFDTDVSILLGTKNNVIKIPVEGVKTDKDGNNYVYIVDNNKVIQKKVTLGLQSDTESEVVSGTKEGESIVLNPSASLQDGSLIKVEMESTK